MDFSLIFDNWELFLTGLGNTVWLVSLALIIGGILAVPLALSQAYNVPYFGKLSLWYSYALRGTPLLVQVYIIYYGLGQFESVRNSVFWVLLKDPYFCALLGFSLNSAAYASEILRGAIVNLPKGLIETAYACGMTRWKVIRRIALPIACRRSIFAYSNEVIFMLHGSVIASTITIVDLLGAGRRLNSQYYVTFEGFITVAFLYMAIVAVISLAFRQIEKRYALT
ncbi:ABC transporter permease subunit [Cognatishimia sp. 1_MG-2023]|uniref:ABC transporter permease n=1 Tax=Cognatishimia sp. 1_MG-2023 TaxID=3062642 RepID=UPI0026E30E1A|nr:ABC transporter permease subunit [Cognatishimia sp. 1_MG-2023]MDO6728251.1 ABC transporter permease subunit [Cognatishimia sp. 1_MG-2023]